MSLRSGMPDYFGAGMPACRPGKRPRIPVGQRIGRDTIYEDDEQHGDRDDGNRLMRQATLAVTAEAAGSGGNHPGKGDHTPEPLGQDLAQAVRRSRGPGEPGFALGRGGDPQRQSGPAAEPLAFPREVVAAEVGATAARRRFRGAR